MVSSRQWGTPHHDPLLRRWTRGEACSLQPLVMSWFRGGWGTPQFFALRLRCYCAAADQAHGTGPLMMNKTSKPTGVSPGQLRSSWQRRGRPDRQGSKMWPDQRDRDHSCFPISNYSIMRLGCYDSAPFHLNLRGCAGRCAIIAREECECGRWALQSTSRLRALRVRLRCMWVIRCNGPIVKFRAVV